MKKLVILGVVLVAAGSLWLLQTRERDRDTSLVLFGNVDIRQIALAFTQSARVTAMLVEEGDVVAPGQVLARLDERELRLQRDRAAAQVDAQVEVVRRLRHGSRPEEIDRARAAVAAADAQERFAGRQYARLRSLSAVGSGKAVSKQDMDNALASLDVAQAQLESERQALRLAEAGPRVEDIAQAEAQLRAARADLDILELRLSECVLRAPEGEGDNPAAVVNVVRARLLEPGDMASPQRAAYTLAVMAPKWVRAYASEPQLARIRPGMAAQVSVDGHAQPLSGMVGFMASVAEFTPKNIQTPELRTSLLYEIRVIVADPDNVLRLGMPATVNLTPQADH